jgi:hypothetical protein
LQNWVGNHAWGNKMHMRRISKTIIVAFAVGTTWCAASAGPVDISALVNADLTGYTSGTLYPQTGGPINVGGVGFNLSTIAPDGHTAVIQTNDAVVSVQIPVNLPDVTTVYTLINSSFGVLPGGQTIGTLAFYRSGDLLNPTTFNLIEGVNVRDHFNGGFVNTLSDNSVVSQTYTDGTNEVRLDRQTFTLPAAFSTDTLAYIILTNLDVNVPNSDPNAPGNFIFLLGQPFLAALSTNSPSETPVPAALPLFATGLGALGLLAKRRKRKAAAAIAA